MRTTVEWSVRVGALDILVIELAHRWRCHEGVERGRRQLAIMVVGAAQTDQHIALRFIETDTLDEAASRRVRAGECFEIDRPAIFDVDRLRTRGHRYQEKEHRNDRPDH